MVPICRKILRTRFVTFLFSILRDITSPILTSQMDLRMTPLYKNRFSELLLIRLIYNTWGLAPHLPIQIAPLRCTITINLTLKIMLQVRNGDEISSQ